MSEKKITEMINLYFDGELAKGEEANLFSLLASDQTARDYFKQLSVIRNAVDNSAEDFPAELEERILRSVGSKAAAKTGIFSNIKIFSAISYAAVLILLLLSGYLFFKVSNYQERVDNLSQQMMIQSQTIELLFNSLPVVEVRATSNKDKLYKPNI
ncbi:MAG TPA: cytochrome c oxidase subunit II transmembrane domain-containing protein [Ignavibacteriaceae bacterium]|nr:cytochrome c oxidase subunit II transmembrane domain-containing protein [Ignavibacteriaceae bacterium]